MATPKVTYTSGEFTCFICKRKLSGLIELVDHCPGQKDDTNLQCDDCIKVTMAAANGDWFAKWLFQMILKRDPATLNFVKNWKPKQ